MIVFGETTLYLDYKINPLALMLENQYGPLTQQILCMIPLVYLVFSNYIPLFQIKFQGAYGLYKNNHTHPSSLTFSAYFMARLITVVTFNFLQLINVNNTQFDKAMNIFESTPYMAKQYFKYFPIVLVLLCVLNAFNVYNKIVYAIGLKQFMYSDILDPMRKSEGKAMLAKERMNKEREIRHSGLERSKSKSYSLIPDFEEDFSLSASIV